MKKVISIFFLLAISTPHIVFSQGLKGFKLQNGLTVYVWEDFSESDVFGIVGVNVGSVEDPDNLTGLAHYLEHVMFKGTAKIGTTNWEKEQPLYEQIIAKYDEMATVSNPEQKESIAKEINRLTIEASQYMATHEIWSLTESMGGTAINASTSYDYTLYHSAFPPEEIYRWLDLNSERFINPVFRAFQPELETVYEEFNRVQDSQGRQVQRFLNESLFSGHPYARPVIGEQEHLKNPQLSGLIKFYNDWYVPENMVLVLVGNIKTSQVRGMIQDKFGRLPVKQSPQRKQYPNWNIKGRKTVSEKLTPYPQIVLGFNGIPKGHPDELALEVCKSILSNNYNTGLLDKLVLDGDLMNAASLLWSFRDQGRILINAVPSYDISQRRFMSLKEVEKNIWKEIKKVQTGEIDEWLLGAIKGDMNRLFDLSFESSETKAEMIVSAFINNQEMSDILTYKERLTALTLDDIKAVALKYFTDDFLVMELLEGKPAKVVKLDKPHYDPINPPRGAESEYTTSFKQLPVKTTEPVFCDFNKIQSKKINDLSKIFYTKNEENEIYTLTLKYGVGTAKMPKLEYAVSLMNSAGIMGALESQELKQAFSELGASCRFRVDNNYIYIIMEGHENNLKESCNLLTRQILMPKLEEKRLNNIIGSEYQSRKSEKDYIENLKEALSEYLLYQNESDYLNRVPLEEIQSLTVSNLTGEFSRATDYEAEIHYVGNLAFDEVYEILSQNLPLKAQERKSSSPEIKEVNKYAENTIFFLPENDAQQSSIYFLINSQPYNLKNKVIINALNSYLSGGFGGLIISEIREYRSMAYETWGRINTPPLPDKDSYFMGFIGTQSDKTIEAIDVFLSILNDLPKNPERVNIIKDNLKKRAITSKPSFRMASQVYEGWKKLGYKEDPAKSELEIIENLTLEDIVSFFNTEIKGNPIAIAVIGNPKQIDSAQLEKYGKVIRLNKGKIFSSK